MVSREDELVLQLKELQNQFQEAVQQASYWRTIAEESESECAKWRNLYNAEMSRPYGRDWHYVRSWRGGNKSTIRQLV